MLRNEAKWIHAILQPIPVSQLSPLLNVGSSTQSFREREQPWITDHLFLPLSKAGINVIHTDLKTDKGIDIAGDLLGEETFTAISQLEIKAALCSNLLEHLTEKEIICTRISDLLPVDGYLVVTVPLRYPFHPDPIDTGFRPDVETLHKLFPGTRLVAGEVLNCGPYIFRGKPLISFITHVTRVLMPFRKPSLWLEALKWTFKNAYVTCLLLQKV